MSAQKVSSFKGLKSLEVEERPLVTPRTPPKASSDDVLGPLMRDKSDELLREKLHVKKEQVQEAEQIHISPPPADTPAPILAREPSQNSSAALQKKLNRSTRKVATEDLEMGAASLPRFVFSAGAAKRMLSRSADAYLKPKELKVEESWNDPDLAQLSRRLSEFLSEDNDVWAKPETTTRNSVKVSLGSKVHVSHQDEDAVKTNVDVQFSGDDGAHFNITYEKRNSAQLSAQSTPRASAHSTPRKIEETAERLEDVARVEAEASKRHPLYITMEEDSSADVFSAAVDKTAEGYDDPDLITVPSLPLAKKKGKFQKAKSFLRSLTSFR